MTKTPSGTQRRLTMGRSDADPCAAGVIRWGCFQGCVHVGAGGRSAASMVAITTTATLSESLTSLGAIPRRRDLMAEEQRLFCRLVQDPFARSKRRMGRPPNFAVRRFLRPIV